jgi:hypothetical protein
LRVEDGEVGLSDEAVAPLVSSSVLELAILDKLLFRQRLSQNFKQGRLVFNGMVMVRYLFEAQVSVDPFGLLSVVDERQIGGGEIVTPPPQGEVGRVLSLVRVMQQVIARQCSGGGEVCLVILTYLYGQSPEHFV